MKAVLAIAVLFVAAIGCGKSDAEIAIEATRDAEATFTVHITATAEADEARAQEMISQFCEVLEQRFKTENELPSIAGQRLQASIDWISYNADSNSRIALILGAVMTDLDRIEDGTHESWDEAYKRSGSQYVPGCRDASWKH